VTITDSSAYDLTGTLARRSAAIPATSVLSANQAKTL